MSIINDALKKAEKKKHSFHDKPFQILSEIDQIKTDAERFILRKWLVWAGTGVVCLSGIILVANSFEKSASSAAFEQKITPKKIEVQRFSAAHAQFNLSGILYDQRNPMAIINQRVVAEDGLVNGAKLLEIQSNSVRLSFRGEEFTLKLK